MTTLKLKNYRVEELNEVQMREVNGGGWWWPAVVGAVSGFIYEVSMNPAAAKNALLEGYHSRRR